MVMVGADPDELDRAAARLRCAAEDIDQHARSLPLELQAVWWAGQVASRFVEALTGDYVPAMRSTTDFLRRAAQELTQQAAQQREASAASSGSLTGPPGSVPTSRSGDGPQVPAAELNGLSADLGRMRQADPGQQRLWWQGLTSTQQTWLLANRPGELTSLDGLPEAVRKQAQDHYSSSIVDKVMTEKATLEGSAAGIVKIFKVEGGFEAERTTFRNGEVALRLDLEAGGGLSVKAAEVLARAGFGGTFRFPSAEEADKFLAGLAHAAAPHGSDWWHALGGPRGLADDAARDVADYLGQHGNRLESSR